MFLLYRLAGLPIDEIDVPYGEGDAERESRRPLLTRQLQKRFQLLGPACPTFRPPEPYPPVEHFSDCWSGDVLVLGNPALNHLAVVVDAAAVEVTKARMRVTPLNRVWDFTTSVYRHHQVLGF